MSQKTVPGLACYNFDVRHPIFILIIFGRWYVQILNTRLQTTSCLSILVSTLSKKPLQDSAPTLTYKTCTTI